MFKSSTQLYSYDENNFCEIMRPRGGKYKSFFLPSSALPNKATPTKKTHRKQNNYILINIVNIFVFPMIFCLNMIYAIF